MTNDEQIKRLKETPPSRRLPRTRLGAWWLRNEHIITRICSAIAVVAFAIGVTAIVKIAAQSACINENLGLRNQPTLQQSNAQITYAAKNKDFATTNNAFVAALANVLLAQPDQQKAEYTLFIGTLEKYESVTAANAAAAGDYIAALQKVAAERTASPLGKC